MPAPHTQAQDAGCSHGPNLQTRPFRWTTAVHCLGTVSLFTTPRPKRAVERTRSPVLTVGTANGRHKCHKSQPQTLIYCRLLPLAVVERLPAVHYDSSL
jgi:hypothetical protein